MGQLSHVGWLLGALFSIAVLGLLSESVLGGSQTRKVVISLETSFKIVVFQRVAKTQVLTSIFAPFWHPFWHHGCSLAHILDFTFWGEFRGVKKAAGEK